MRLSDKNKSIRTKLFFTLSLLIFLIIVSLILINNVVLESFYIYTKVNTIREVYENVNMYYKGEGKINLEDELNKTAIKNNFDILIKTDENMIIFSTSKDTQNAFEKMNALSKMVIENDRKNNIYQEENVKINKVKDSSDGLRYIMLSAKLDNGYYLYVRIALAPIEESVSVSNTVLFLIGSLAIIIAGVSASLISKRFTNPIVELNNITKKMSKLDFTQKYISTDAEDEVNELGKNINTLSIKLEKTIKQLRDTNIELEKDIEEKSKIDEMRKQFISDVSHELKTPIAIIQGYAEGLLENVNEDEESRRMYAEVILDESNKMDKMVKELLELMKLEYGNQKIEKEDFNISELIKEVIKKLEKIAQNKNIEVKFDGEIEYMVNSDQRQIEQVLTNYLTNAIRYGLEMNGEYEIKISVDDKNDKYRINVFNTGENIDEEELERIWKRFYKTDASRNREDGGTGIGLSIVKAIMNNLNNDYGVINKDNGVVFYFEVDKIIEQKINK